MNTKMSWEMKKKKEKKIPLIWKTVRDGAIWYLRKCTKNWKSVGISNKIDFHFKVQTKPFAV